MQTFLLFKNNIDSVVTINVFRAVNGHAPMPTNLWPFVMCLLVRKPYRGNLPKLPDFGATWVYPDLLEK